MLSRPFEIVKKFVVVYFLQMSKISHSDEHGVVKMLARCLPHIVPNVLLAKREVSNSS